MIVSSSVGSLPSHAHSNPSGWHAAAVLEHLVTLSLLEPLIAVAWQESFARVAELQLHTYQRVLLFAPIWLVYTADRWLDANRAGAQLSGMKRHRIHRLFKHPVLVGWHAIVLLSLAVAFAYLSPTEWAGNAGLLSAALTYLYAVHRLGPVQPAGAAYRLLLSKELWAAAIFSAGAALFVALDSDFGPSYQLALGLFVVLAFLNLKTISHLEVPSDQAAEPRSDGVRRAGTRRSLLLGLGSLTCTATVAGIALHTERAAPLFFALAFSSAALAGTFQTSSRRSVSSTHALLDAALLIPAVTLFF